MTQPEGSSAHDLEKIRVLLFGAELARLEEKAAADRSAAAAQPQDLERRGATLATLGQRFTAESGPGPAPGG